MQVNQFRLTQRLGKGAFGTVYRAHGDGRTVAVKVLRRSLLKRHRVGMTNSALDQLMREIAVMKKVHHPNCVELHEVIDDPSTDEVCAHTPPHRLHAVCASPAVATRAEWGHLHPSPPLSWHAPTLVMPPPQVFLMMEYIHGGTVQRLCDTHGALPEVFARIVVREVACGLHYLHGQGIVHRDIKPENMLVLPPPPSDWLHGLATSLGDKLTQWLEPLTGVSRLEQMSSALMNFHYVIDEFPLCN